MHQLFNIIIKLTVQRPLCLTRSPRAQVMADGTKLAEANRRALVTQKSQGEDAHLNFLTLNLALF